MGLFYIDNIFVQGGVVLKTIIRFVLSSLNTVKSTNHSFHLILDPPQVSIQLGKSLVASDIREGVDVYFDCMVSANPTPKSKLVTWLHNVSTFNIIFINFYYNIPF